jgi:hypothetical protein
MDARERREILGEWGVRVPTPREQREARRLAEDLEGSPLAGKPLRGRLRNFRPAVDGYVASIGGPLPYMRRLREIHEAVAGHESRLEDAWRRLAAATRDDAEFSRRWLARVERWNFSEVNDLIDRHNRWYPAEARLPMDPRTGDYVHVAGEPYRLEHLDAAWALERFPPSRPGSARAAAPPEARRRRSAAA